MQINKYFCQTFLTYMKILFKLTSRSRPQKFLDTIDNILHYVSLDCDFKILCSLDLDDKSMTGLPMPNDKRITYVFGSSKSKIDAINRDMEVSGDWDILINMSDDMKFTVKDFNKIIEHSFNGETDLCLHLPDGNQNEVLITLAILGRKYYDRFGYIYHPDYKSLWCDMEMTEVSKKLGKYMYVPSHVYRHLHPAFGLAPNDLQYQHTESFFREDEITYRKRKANDFA